MISQAHLDALCAASIAVGATCDEDGDFVDFPHLPFGRKDYTVTNIFTPYPNPSTGGLDIVFNSKIKGVIFGYNSAYRERNSLFQGAEETFYIEGFLPEYGRIAWFGPALNRKIIFDRERKNDPLRFSFDNKGSGLEITAYTDEARARIDAVKKGVNLITEFVEDISPDRFPFAQCPEICALADWIRRYSFASPNGQRQEGVTRGAGPHAQANSIAPL